MFRVIIKYLIACLIACAFSVQFIKCSGVHAAPRQPRPQRNTWLVSATNAVNPAAPIALDGITRITGAQFADHWESGIEKAPPVLAGVRVWIGDECQPIKYVARDYIDVILTRRTSWVIVTAQNGRVYYAPVRMADTAPGFYLTDPQSEIGALPLALWRQGAKPPQPLTDLGLPLSTPDEPVVMLLDGSGLRHATSIQVTLDGAPLTGIAWHPHPFLPGQDELSVRMPEGVTHRGPLELVAEAGGVKSNAVKVWVR